MSGEHFDAVVVGSGFGGGVSALRLGEAGLKVCVLERGRAYAPGTFPRTPAELGVNFWDPSKHLYGIWNFWAFKRIEAAVSSCLGGGSIVYANVLLRKDRSWFTDAWPVTYDELVPHYEAVERVLAPERFPDTGEPYVTNPKFVALDRAAKSIGVDIQRPPLGVRFGSEPGEPLPADDNLYGVRRYSCRLIGECNAGCNLGAKNTVDLTFLSRFAELPTATIRTLSEVQAFAPRPGGGFTVEGVRHDATRGTQTPFALTTDRLVLSAGTLGTTYLLLRNAAAFPKLNCAALGTRFCGNGDLLGFVKDANVILEPSIGPVITVAMRYPDTADGGTGPGIYIEDGGYPVFVSWLSEMTNLRGVRRAAHFAWNRLRDAFGDSPVSNISAEISALLGDGSSSARRVPLLGMGLDVADGKMSLRKGKWLAVDWSTKTSMKYFDGVRAAMQALATQLGGTFEISPLWYMRHRVVTVHPLGGCPMGTPAEGVVDSYGQVYGCPGMSIADGSVMPGPVGANPSLTIAALAHRFAEHTAASAP